MGNLMKAIAISILLAVLSACGTTSGLKSGDQTTYQIDFSRYENVVVLKFNDGTAKRDLPGFVGENFANKISNAITEKGIFQVVSRESLDAEAIIIDGDVTLYKEGNAALRFMLPAAGSSGFDATVRFKNAMSGDILGTIVVDRNSWVLGGVMAATQTTEKFMSSAAEFVANEIHKALPKRALGSRVSVNGADSGFATVSHEPADERTIVQAQDAKVASAESKYQSIIDSLNSNDPIEMRNAAKLVGEQKLFFDAGLIAASKVVLEQAIKGEVNSKDKMQIDGLAWCALNLGNSGSQDSEYVLLNVLNSDLPKKVKNHARHALKVLRG